MATLETHGIALHYELFGDRTKPPVVLLHGLVGSGSSWGSQVERFARNYFVVLPDQRGTGQTSRSETGYTVEQMAADTASLLESLDVGPAHAIGTSTGGAIAQVLALDHAAHVRSVTIASSFAHADDNMQRALALRRKLAARADMRTLYSSYARILFGARYMREHPQRVTAWTDALTALPPERQVSVKRIDMTLAHDTRARLAGVQQPSFVVCGSADSCARLPHSRELARLLPDAQFAVLPGGGHFLHIEQDEPFFETVRAFIDRN